MNTRYDSGREAFGEGRLSWTDDDIVAYLVGGGYVLAQSHRSVQALRAVIAGPVPVEKRGIRDGYAAASPVTFEAVKSDEPIVALVLAKRDATLIAWLDEVEGFPLRSSGLDVVITLPKDKAFFFRT